MRKVRLLLAVLLICTACGSPATRQPGQPDPEDRAGELRTQGQHGAAAEEYLRLSRLYPNKVAGYQLRAAHSYLDAGDQQTAAKLLEQIKPSNRIETWYRTLLQAQLAMNGGQPAIALEMTAAPPAGMPDVLAVLQHRIRAGAFEALGDHSSAVRELVTLEQLESVDESRQESARRIWNDLTRMDNDALRALSGSSDSTLGGWAELALMQRSLSGKPDILKQSLSSWIEAHADHSAVPAITGEIMAGIERYSTAPVHIAILLPFTGQFAGAAAAIRDGFVSAWFMETGQRPLISIHDANALNIMDQYRAAVAAGADFVVGPLEKTAINALLESGNLPVMTLALNYTDHPASREETAAGVPSLIEFGLAPEDEAVQAARRGVFEGHKSVAILVPDNDWGTRLGKAFADEWQAYGGRIVEQVRYPARAADFSDPVEELLNIDSSELRHAQLRQRIGRRLEGGARTREDVDMIFLAAVPVYARQIVPQFRYHGVDHIPVFASSHVFTGVIDPQTGADMDGVRFPDMPWILQPREGDADLRATIDSNWPAETSGFRRLFGFGIDAYRVIPHLPRLVLERGSTWPGETGELYSDGGGRIYRKLLWAKFVDGRPRLLEEQ